MQRDLLTLDELRLALTNIPADDRETWVNIGNAVKTEYGDDGWFAWDEWSQGGASYNSADAKSVWRSLQVGHVRLGTIIKLASDNGWQRDRKAITPEDLKRYQPSTVASRAICKEYDEPIPAARRKALPGVQLCVGCQTQMEGR